MTAGHVRQLCHKTQENLPEAHARWALGRDSHLQSGVLRLLGGTGVPSISAARTPSCTMSSTSSAANSRARNHNRRSRSCGRISRPTHCASAIRSAFPLPSERTRTPLCGCQCAAGTTGSLSSRHKSLASKSVHAAGIGPTACVQVVLARLIGWACSGRLCMSRRGRGFSCRVPELQVGCP